MKTNCAHKHQIYLFINSFMYIYTFIYLFAGSSENVQKFVMISHVGDCNVWLWNRNVSQY